MNKNGVGGEGGGDGCNERLLVNEKVYNIERVSATHRHTSLGRKPHTSVDSYRLAKSPSRLLAFSRLGDIVKKQIVDLPVRRSPNYVRHVAVYEGQYGGP